MDYSILFLSRVRPSIEMMKQANMNEVQIACILTEIRSAAISEEFFRLEQLLKKNPPTHYHLDDMLIKIKEK
jgi:hypothetical protein